MWAKSEWAKSMLSGRRSGKKIFEVRDLYLIGIRAKQAIHKGIGIPLCVCKRAIKIPPLYDGVMWMHIVGQFDRTLLHIHFLELFDLSRAERDIFHAIGLKEIIEHVRHRSTESRHNSSIVHTERHARLYELCKIDQPH